MFRAETSGVSSTHLTGTADPPVGTHTCPAWESCLSLWIPHSATSTEVCSGNGRPLGIKLLLWATPEVRSATPRRVKPVPLGVPAADLKVAEWIGRKVYEARQGETPWPQHMGEKYRTGPHSSLTWKSDCTSNNIAIACS